MSKRAKRSRPGSQQRKPIKADRVSVPQADAQPVLQAELVAARAREAALQAELEHTCDHLNSALETNRTLQSDLSDATIAHEAKLSALSDLIEMESGQRVALSQDVMRLRGAADRVQAHHLEDIEILTNKLAQTEERAILADDACKIVSRAQAESDKNLTLSHDEARAAARTLEARIATQVEDRAALEGMISGLQADLVKLRLTRDTEETRTLMATKVSDKRMGELRASTASLETALKTAQTKLRAQDKTMTALHRQVGDLQEHNQNLETTLDEMKNSTSWRATATLRNASSVLRKRK